MRDGGGLPAGVIPLKKGDSCLPIVIPAKAGIHTTPKQRPIRSIGMPSMIDRPALHPHPFPALRATRNGTTRRGPLL